ncbi:histone H2A-Bbd type 1-like isoform X2 [Cervus canadensis]|uniref:histone H2A-Bbd type 1-like isoform X2 n=1 Tax=Cervus canadensis TaxID=1574408 RepID=UPI0018B7D433|nr:histone H2A-Bbd type 1-like isoform X2 [Cervus canadensis]
MLYRSRSWDLGASPGPAGAVRAELQFPVSRVDRLLRERQGAQRLSSATPVFLTAVLEYLTANILDLAGKEAGASHRMRISPEHVQRALINNENLCHLFEPNAFSQPASAPTPRKRK